MKAKKKQGKPRVPVLKFSGAGPHRTRRNEPNRKQKHKTNAFWNAKEESLDKNEQRKDYLATTRKAITQDLTVAEAIVIQTCLNGYLPLVAQSEDFPGKEPFIVTLSRIVTPLAKEIDVELTKIDAEVDQPQQLDLFKDGNKKNAKSVIEFLGKER